MSGRSLSLYETADWGSRLAGVVQARRDGAGTLFIDEVRVESIHVRGHFSILTCANGQTMVVLTGFLRLVPDPTRGKPIFEPPTAEGI